MRLRGRSVPVHRVCMHAARQARMQHAAMQQVIAACAPLQPPLLPQGWRPLPLPLPPNRSPAIVPLLPVPRLRSQVL